MGGCSLSGLTRSADLCYSYQKTARLGRLVDRRRQMMRMMRTLLILRCRARVSAKARKLRGGGLSKGPGSEDDRVHTKPERSFSKRRSKAAERSPIRRPILHSSVTIGHTPLNSSLRGVVRARLSSSLHDSIIVFRVSDSPFGTL
jgi:hypothetical protein